MIFFHHSFVKTKTLSTHYNHGTSATNQKQDTSDTPESLDIDLANLGPLPLQLGHDHDQHPVLHPGSDAQAVDAVLVGHARRRQRDVPLKDAHSPLGRHEALQERLVAGPVDDARDAERVGVRVPVDADVVLFRAGQRGVHDVGRLGGEDVDGGLEGVGVGVVGAVALRLVAHALEEGVVHEASHHGGEVERAASGAVPWRPAAVVAAPSASASPAVAASVESAGSTTGAVWRRRVLAV